MNDERELPDIAARAELETLAMQPPQPRAVAAPDLRLVQDVQVRVEVRLGGRELRIAELLALGEGDTVALDESVDAPVELRVEGRVVARGELVVCGERFGVRITEIGAA
ncbi:MAG TPA: FliM/FliN family flagellar motor switch protein [Candidatus Binatia bacterium]|nr:FliM/FliN family flagellar motor switch protein [Candidatus Binatia bacterium]